MTLVERETVDETELDRIAWNLPSPHAADESAREDPRAMPAAASEDATGDADELDTSDR